MKASLSILLSFLAWSAFCGRLIVETPCPGDLVSLLDETQREFLALDGQAREDYLTDKARHDRLNEAGCRPRDVQVRWRFVPAGPDEKAESYVVLCTPVYGGAPLRVDTRETSATFRNLEIGTDYFIDIGVKGGVKGKPCLARVKFRTADTAPRLLDFGPTVNARDLGGRMLKCGRRVRQGLLMRSAAFQGPLPQGIRVVTDLDLRNGPETKGMTASPLGPRVRWVNVAGPQYEGLNAAGGKSAFAKIFRVLTDEKNYPVVFHCVAGASRTGSLAYVLEGLLGYDEAELDRDFQTTAMAYPFPYPYEDRANHKLLRLKTAFAAYPGGTMNERIEAYAASCGIAKSEIAAFRRILCENAIRDIPYDPKSGAFGLGDLYLPSNVTERTQMVITIHGGGWTGGDRASWSGVAEFFRDELGFAAFNIEYRLASGENPWPKCGDDCVAAANHVLSEDFKRRYGLKYDRVWICGGSAGGHLTLWTLVNLPPDKVAGAVSISAIGDPDCDVLGSRGCQRELLGKGMDYARMDPRRRIKAGMAPLLCTHVREDKVVPIASHRAFADAYRARGNRVVFFEYPCTVEPGLSGHCTWRAHSGYPPRLIAAIRSAITDFITKELK